MSSSPPPTSPRKPALPAIHLPPPPPSPPASGHRMLDHDQPAHTPDHPNTPVSDASYAAPLNPEDADDDDDDEDGAQYAMPMDDPYAEVEHGWRRMSEASGPAHLPSAPRHSEEHGARRTLASAHNDEVADQLSGFSFANPQPSAKRAPVIQKPPSSRKFSLPAPLNSHTQSGSINLSMRRSDQPNLFRPPSSSVPNKSSFSLSELVINQSLTNRPRIPSFSTELEPISGSPTSPDSPMQFSSDPYLPNQSLQPGVPGPSESARAPLPTAPNSGPTLAWKARADLINVSGPAAPSSSSSSSFCSSSDDCLLRRASSSSLASAASVASSNNVSTTSALKARRGSKKPLSLAMPPLQLSGLGTASTTATSVPPMSRVHLHPSSNDAQSSAFRSLPPSPRFSTTDLAHTRDQIVGMKANVTGGLSMKRRTSIPRLSLGGISSIAPSLDPHRRASLAVNGSSSNDYARLLGRNLENSTVRVAATPARLHFDPVAAEEGKHELMSSQVGSGGRGQIERPAPGADGEPTEEYPYQYGPREILPGLFIGSEQNARDPNLLREMGFGYIVNVAKEVECPWTLPVASQSAVTTPSLEDCAGPVESQSISPGATTGMATPPRLQQTNSGHGRTLLVRPTSSTPNLHRSFKRSPETVNTKTGRSADPLLMAGSTGDKKLEKGFVTAEFEADEHTGRPALEYRKLPWSHDQEGLAAGAFEAAFEGIDRAMAAGRRTLVHCQCGVSRSATFVMAFCMRRSVLEGGRGAMHDSYEFVKEKSPWAGPNMALIYQLIEYEKVLRKGCNLPVVPGVQEEEEDEGTRTPTRGNEK